MTDNGTTWRKSSYSDGSGGQCVEVGQGPGVRVRDTKDKGAGSVLHFTTEAWNRLTRTLR